MKKVHSARCHYCGHEDRYFEEDIIEVEECIGCGGRKKTKCKHCGRIVLTTILIVIEDIDVFEGY